MQYSSTFLIFRKGPRILTYRMPSRKKNKNWKRLKKNWLDSKIPCKTWILLKVFYVTKYKGSKYLWVQSGLAQAVLVTVKNNFMHSYMLLIVLMRMLDTISLCSPCWYSLFDSLASIFFLNPLEVAQNNWECQGGFCNEFSSRFSNK